MATSVGGWRFDVEGKTSNRFFSRRYALCSMRFVSNVFEKISQRLIKKAEMQVELCEIPLAGALEILRNEAYMNVRCNDEGPAHRQGQRSRSGFFISLLGGDFVVVGELHEKSPPALSQ